MNSGFAIASMALLAAARAAPRSRTSPPRAHNLPRIGTNDLQADSAYQRMVREHIDRYVAYRTVEARVSP